MEGKSTQFKIENKLKTKIFIYQFWLTMRKYLEVGKTSMYKVYIKQNIVISHVCEAKLMRWERFLKVNIQSQNIYGLYNKYKYR